MFFKLNVVCLQGLCSALSKEDFVDVCNALHHHDWLEVIFATHSHNGTRRQLLQLVLLTIALRTPHYWAVFVLSDVLYGGWQAST